MFHKDYERKINQLVNELTLEEKIKDDPWCGSVPHRGSRKTWNPPNRDVGWSDRGAVRIF